MNLDFTTTDAIVFDLGGVILPLDYQASIVQLSTALKTDVSPHFTRLAQNESFDAFERGEIPAAQFRSHLRQIQADAGRATERVSVSDSQLDAAWNAMLLQLPMQNIELLRELAQHKRIFLLSNTNEIHYRAFMTQLAEQLGGEKVFEEIFEGAHFSHFMGARKPEARIYQMLSDLHQLTPSRTLFIDDNPHNVAGARQVGWHAHHHPSSTPLVPLFQDFLEARRQGLP